MQTAGLDKTQARVKTAGTNSKNHRHEDDITLMAESEEELKSLLLKMKEKSEKAGLKLNIEKTNTVTSSPITSWQIDGETMETVRDLFSWAPKSLQMVTATMKLKDACSLEEKYDKPRQHTKKQRHYLPTEVCLINALVFPVVTYGCESWTIKKAEHRIDAFELWCWRRLLRVPWTERISNQSILKEINPKYSLEGLTLKLKLQYFGHLM